MIKVARLRFGEEAKRTLSMTQDKAQGAMLQGSQMPTEQGVKLKVKGDLAPQYVRTRAGLQAGDVCDALMATCRQWRRKVKDFRGEGHAAREDKWSRRCADKGQEISGDKHCSQYAHRQGSWPTHGTQPGQESISAGTELTRAMHAGHVEQQDRGDTSQNQSQSHGRDEGTAHPGERDQRGMRAMAGVSRGKSDANA